MYNMYCIHGILSESIGFFKFYIFRLGQMCRPFTMKQIGYGTLRKVFYQISQVFLI